MDLAGLVARAPTLSLPTPRLLLRRFSVADVPFAIAQENDRAIMRWIRDPQPPAAVRARAEALAAAYQGKDGEWLALTVCERVTNAPIGLAVCRVTSAATATVEIGYRLDASVHRRGYGRETCAALITFLFDVVRVRKLVAFVVADNEPSWRLLEQLGMAREAQLREYAQLAGAWHDEFVYGLLAREWGGAPR